MRNILIFIGIALFAVGCSKEEAGYVEYEPIVQEQEQGKTKLYDLLLSADPDLGWAAELKTGDGSVFHYNFKFGADREHVVSRCDCSLETIMEESTSTFGVNFFQDLPTLFFNSYGYVHLLSDVRPHVMNGEEGRGLRSDIEFGFDREEGDKLYFIGVKYGTRLVLTKAVHPFIDDYQDRIEEYLLELEMSARAERIAEVLDDETVRMVKLPNNTYFTLYYDHGTSTVNVVNYGLLNNADGITFSTTVTPALEGLIFTNTLNIGGTTVKDLYFDEDNETFEIEVEGNRVPFDEIPVETVFNKSLSANNTFLYRLTIPANFLTMGVDNPFNQLIQSTAAAHTAAAFTYGYIMMDLWHNGTNYLYVYPASGARKAVTGPFTVTGDQVSFTSLTPNATDYPAGSALRDAVLPLANRLGGRMYTMQWVKSKTYKRMLVGLVDNADPDFMVYGFCSRT